jgi:hypothetical protein
MISRELSRFAEGARMLYTPEVGFWRRRWNCRDLYFLLLIPVVYVLIFNYVPIYGVLMAFKRFAPRLGVWRSPWVGLYNFERLIKSPNFLLILRNTLVLSVYSLIAGFPFPLILAICVNHSIHRRFRKITQTITFAPHFLSSVLVVGLITQFLGSRTGALNIFLIRHTPYKKDVIRMVADAAGGRGFKMGVYYSIPDWHHPNYPNRGRHHELWGNRSTDEPDYDKYFAYMENQVTELCSNYGEISQLFWDLNILDYNNREFNDRMRKLQPSMLINNRGPDNGDYATPERDYDTPDRNTSREMVFSRHTEANQSLGRESWGHRIDEDYYNPKYLMQSMDKIMAMGGNYLLNVGPKADGTFDERDMASLKRVGQWYHKVKEAFAPDTYPAASIRKTGLFSDCASCPPR